MLHALSKPRAVRFHPDLKVDYISRLEGGKFFLAAFFVVVFLACKARSHHHY